MSIRTVAAVLEGRDTELVIKELLLSAPKEREVLVKVDAAGLCRSDLNAINGHTRYDMPLVLGHEGVGTVVETGPGVTRVKVGDRVVLSWAAWCGECFFCKKGATYLCNTIAQPRGKGFLPDWTTRFSDAEGNDLFHFNGVSSFSEYTVVYETGCVKIDRDIPVADAAAFGCSVVTGVGAVFNTARFTAGSTAVVIGAGSVGMSVIQALRVKGATLIVLVDPDESKWALAVKNGATHTTRGLSAEMVRDLTGGFGADFVFDCVASQETLQGSLAALRRGGDLVMVGSPHPLAKVELSPIEFHLEKNLLGSLYGSSDPQRDIPVVAELYQKGSLSLEGFTSGEFKLEEINTALRELEARGGKYIITFQEKQEVELI